MINTETVTPQVRQGFQVEDIAYHDSAGEQMLARLYLPTQPAAAVVEIHGGGWTQGHRLNNARLDEALAEAGILVMAVDFSMPPRFRYPTPVADINLAIRWLKAYSDRIGLPCEKVGGIGLSSGGHQLLLAAMRPDDPRYAALPFGTANSTESKLDSSLAFIVLCWPVADPLARYRMAVEKQLPLVNNHNAYWADEAEMEEGNPQLLLERGETVLLPPALVIQGTRDDNLTAEMSPRFADVYRARGGELQLEMFEGQPHNFFDRAPDSDDTKRGVRMIRDFICQRTET